jgi:hypothetical protein
LFFIGPFWLSDTPTQCVIRALTVFLMSPTSSVAATLGDARSKFFADVLRVFMYRYRRQVPPFIRENNDEYGRKIRSS